jgi:hypothetical protein
MEQFVFSKKNIDMLCLQLMRMANLDKNQANVQLCRGVIVRRMKFLFDKYAGQKPAHISNKEFVLRLFKKTVADCSIAVQKMTSKKTGIPTDCGGLSGNYAPVQSLSGGFITTTGEVGEKMAFRERAAPTLQDKAVADTLETAVHSRMGSYDRRSTNAPQDRPMDLDFSLDDGSSKRSSRFNDKNDVSPDATQGFEGFEGFTDFSAIDGSSINALPSTTNAMNSSRQKEEDVATAFNRLQTERNNIGQRPAPNIQRQMPSNQKQQFFLDVPSVKEGLRYYVNLANTIVNSDQSIVDKLSAVDTEIVAGILKMQYNCNNPIGNIIVNGVDYHIDTHNNIAIHFTKPITNAKKLIIDKIDISVNPHNINRYNNMITLIIGTDEHSFQLPDNTLDIIQLMALINNTLRSEKLDIVFKIREDSRIIATSSTEFAINNGENSVFKLLGFVDDTYEGGCEYTSDNKHSVDIQNAITMHIEYNNEDCRIQLPITQRIEQFVKETDTLNDICIKFTQNGDALADVIGQPPCINLRFI